LTEAHHPSLDTGLIESLTDLERAREIAAGCVRCPLKETRTQVVFGEGNPGARLMLVGEGPGEEEDARGRPFVGRAGQLLDSALAEAGIPRDAVWVTNTVRCRPTKIEAGRVANRPPRVGEIRACAVWMETELRLVAPRVVVCLGAVAAKALIGKEFRLTQERGQLFPGPAGTEAIATLHPSYIIRQRDSGSRVQAREMLVQDLRLAIYRAGA
jgi:uracil-DNA glycosylase family protein